MRGLGWLTPQTFAGSLRTWIGKQAGGFDDTVVSQLLKVQIRGPLPVHEGQLFFPAPSDLVMKKDSTKAFRVRPVEPHGVVELPSGVPQLCFLTSGEEEDFKSGERPAFVSHNWMRNWLVDEQSASPENADCLPRLEADERTHVKVDPGSYAAEEKFLYTSIGLSFQDDIGIAAQVETSMQIPTETVHPLGGERRLAYWETAYSRRAFSGVGTSAGEPGVRGGICFAPNSPALKFHPEMGYGRPSLALDVIEPFRHPAGDRLVMKILNLRVLGVDDFEERDGRTGVWMKPRALVRFFEHYETWMMEGQPSLRDRLKHDVEGMAHSLRTGEPLRPYRMREALGGKSGEGTWSTSSVMI
jgi:hypothetical protein